jgi:hypothetical protein
VETVVNRAISPTEKFTLVPRFEQLHSLKTCPEGVWVGTVGTAVKKALVIDRAHDNRLDDFVSKC